jgi:triacylglycerol lipase
VFDALSPQRRRLVLSVAIALLLIMAVAMISVIRLIAASPDPVSQTDPGPVLLVPGYGGNVQSLEPLAEALRATGRTAVIVDPVGDGTGDLRSGTCSGPGGLDVPRPSDICRLADAPGELDG